MEAVLNSDAFQKVQSQSGLKSYFATVKNGAIMGQILVLISPTTLSLNQFDRLRVTCIARARDRFYWLAGLTYVLIWER